MGSESKLRAQRRFDFNENVCARLHVHVNGRSRQGFRWGKFALLFGGGGAWKWVVNGVLGRYTPLDF